MLSPRLSLSALLLVQGMAYYGLTSRTESPHVSRPLAAFPSRIGEWHVVREGAIGPDERDVLRADDYLVRDYSGPGGKRASLFVAYFRSQRAGQTPHSPKNCLPGAGWVWSVADFIPVTDSIAINRYVVSRPGKTGDEHAVVLYWYQSHGRVIASEYRAAAFTAWDALRYNSTDTSLLRVVAPTSEEGLDFVRASWGEFGRYNQGD
jgi:EpsI family protein